MDLITWMREHNDELRPMLSGFDPNIYSSADAAEGFEIALLFERSIGVVKSKFAHRVETGNGWQESGSHDAAEFLATRTGEDVRDVSRDIETAAALQSFPELDDAVRAGEVSLSRAAAIASGGAIDPSVVPELVDEATKVQSQRQFAKNVEQKLQGFRSPEGQTRVYETAKKNRRANWWVDQRRAMFGLYVEGPLDGYAQFRSIIEPEVERAFRRANKTDDRGNAGNHRYDALLTVLKESRPKRRTRHDVLVRADQQAMERGHVKPGEVCELVGAGPVPVEIAREMIDSGDARLIRTDEIALAKDVMRAHRHNRDIGLELVLQVIARDGGACKRPGCDWNGRLHLEHRIPAARGGPPELWNLYLICPPDHQKKTHSGYSIVGPLDGEVAWVKRRQKGDGGSGYPFNDDEDPAMYRQVKKRWPRAG